MDTEKEAEWGAFAINRSMIPPARVEDNSWRDNSSTTMSSQPCLLIFFVAAQEEIIELRFTEINLRDK